MADDDTQADVTGNQTTAPGGDRGDAVRFCPGCGRAAAARFCEGCGLDLGTVAVGAAGSAARPGSALLVLLAALLAVGAVVGTVAKSDRQREDRRLAQGPAPRPAAGPAAASGAPPPAQRPSREQIEEVLGQSGLRQAVAASPDDASARLRLGQALYRAAVLQPDYFDEAEETFRKATELDPELADARRGLANLYYDFDRHGDAIEAYRAYLEQRPDDLSARTDLGTMLLYSKRHDEAVATYREVLERDPGFIQAIFNLGNALHAKGEWQEALATYERVKAHPNVADLGSNVDAMIELTRARMEGRDPQAGLPAGHPPMGPAATAAGPGATASAAPPPPPPPAAPTASSPGVQGEVEAMLLRHPIFGPKLVRLEWDTPTQLKAYTAGFPMDQMPDTMRDSFLDRLRTSLEEIRVGADLEATFRVEIVDQGRGKVMATVDG